MTGDLVDSTGSKRMSATQVTCSRFAMQKMDTLEGEELSIPTSYSHIKFKICKELIKNWQCSRDSYDSESGRRERSYVPCVDKKFLIYNKFLIFCLMSHVHSLVISKDLKKLTSPLCPCGRLGDTDHYTFNCSLTNEYNLKEPAIQHRVSWFKNLQETESVCLI
ncbi:hypothetical protein AVEN_110498-1 [Araneus ventricosus]|uniref:Uncharacterized protein n=1 Tax=Araneus ventricosus TaxID=182803 RepID=A0A4Y2V9A1_ARAVE|nr:hypothetical protein AVEN_110498-1 [Araneus ventricosus]